MKTAIINGISCEVEIVDDDHQLSVCFIDGYTLEEVNDLLADYVNISFDDEVYENLGVSMLALINSTDDDMWEGTRITAILVKA